MFEQEQRWLLNDAASKFPEGCLCEDCGECAYCRFILNHLTDRGMNPIEDIKKTPNELLRENVQFNIPIAETEQIYELGRMFQRPCFKVPPTEVPHSSHTRHE